MNTIRQLFLVVSIFFISFDVFSQSLPIDYTEIKTVSIADIQVSGDATYEKYVIIGFSGFSIGQTISIPGKEITASIKRFWQQGYFSDVRIFADSISKDSVWLNIYLKQRPKIENTNYIGIRKTEKDDISEKVTTKKGTVVTPDLINRIEYQVKKYFEEKGFIHAVVKINQSNGSEPGLVDLNIVIDKANRIKLRKMVVEGNKALSVRKIDGAMKKTNRPTLLNLFKSKKFVPSLFEEDKKLLIEKYAEIGYRDAKVLKDSVTEVDSTHVDLFLKIEEGKKYYFGDIQWVGNTVYPTEVLSAFLNISKGDIYNQKLLQKRLFQDEDAVSSLYTDNGYLFFQIDPVETSINEDTINFEMRMYEGKPATINKVAINGNDRVYEHVVRRELRTRPGTIYSQTDLVRSLRDLAQLNLFNEEKLYQGADIQPNMEDGTVDLAYNLETKSSDQFQFSAGISPQGPVLSVGVKFTNFAIQNLFRKKMYRIVPQGEGQTLSVQAQANGQYYQNYSISFLEPWLGGKRPNSLSVSFYYSILTGFSERYRNAMNNYVSNYYNGMYGGYGNNYGNNSYMSEYDSGTKMQTFGVSVGIGNRLRWPDDYFSLYSQISYNYYFLKNWADVYFGFKDGRSNNFSVGLTLQRNSIDNPIYTRRGSIFTMSVSATPPYSLFTGEDYSKMSPEQTRKWIEYHKWKFQAKYFAPLSKDEKLVLMARVEYGFVGYYNKYKRSPFEKFYVGGDGMGGYSTPGTETIGLRGYESGSLTPHLPNSYVTNGNIYTRLTMELRYPIMMQQMTSIWALAFVEGGNCWSDIKQFNPFDVKRAAGVGVRIFLPMFGLLGIDWGYGFDNAYGATKQSGSKFTFVLGQEF